MANFDYSLPDLPTVDKDGNTITDDNPLTLEDVLVRIIESTDPVLGLVTGDMLDNHLDSPYNWALLGLFLRDIFLQDQIDNIDIPDAVVNATITVRGIIELATVAEAEGLADQFRAITPHLLGEALKHVNAQATTSQRGTAEIANQTEGRTGTNNDRIMTSLRVLDFLRNGTGVSANTTRKGTVQHASQSDVQNEENTSRVTTISSLYKTEAAISLNVSVVDQDDNSDSHTVETAEKSLTEMFGPVIYQGGIITITGEITTSASAFWFELSLPNSINLDNYEWVGSGTRVHYVSIENNRLRVGSTTVGNGLTNSAYTVIGTPI